MSKQKRNMEECQAYSIEIRNPSISQIESYHNTGGGFEEEAIPHKYLTAEILGTETEIEPISTVPDVVKYKLSDASNRNVTTGTTGVSKQGDEISQKILIEMVTR